MARRHLTTALTMLVLAAILVLGVVIGAKTLFAPLPGAKTSVEPTPSCTDKTVKKGQRIRASQVQVSVYNGGSRSGLADDTMKQLTKRGFTAGSVGNAPDEKVRRVQVRTTEKHDMAARLVARQFGRGTKVRVTTKDLGPGIDVVVGNRFNKLAKARRMLVAQTSSTVCVPASSPTEGLG